MCLSWANMLFVFNGPELEYLAARQNGTGTLWSSVVAMINTTCGGGSSRVLSNALKAGAES
jgi:hypothetical protein